MKIPIFEHHVIRPLERFGLESSFWDIHIDTLIFTWIAMAALLGVVIAAHFYFKRKTLNPFTYAGEQMIEFFVNLCNESFGFFKYEYFAFIMTLFVFTLFCNAAGMLPFVEEPTQDINTALACGLSSFLYVQYQKIKLDGFWGYIKEYFHPIFVLFPLNVVGEFAKVASMSFRLFGNILGGGIIIMIVFQALEPYRLHFMLYTAIMLPIIMITSKRLDPKKHPYISKFLSLNNLIIFSAAWLMMFFGLFEGVVQAFVITMLTVTYLSLVEKQDDETQDTHAEEAVAKGGI